MTALLERTTDIIMSCAALFEGRWRAGYGHALAALATCGGDDERRFIAEVIERRLEADRDLRFPENPPDDLEVFTFGAVLAALDAAAGDGRFRTGAAIIARRYERQPRAHGGAFLYTHNTLHQVWLDGFSMFAPFGAYCAAHLDMPSLMDDVAAQFLAVESKLRDPYVGLLRHGWDESHKSLWAQPETGWSPYFFAAGHALFGASLVDTIHAAPVDFADRSQLVAMFQRWTEATIRWQDRTTGLWYQILDQPRRPGNRIESTANATICLALAKGADLDLVPRAVRTLAGESFGRLLARSIVETCGTISIIDATPESVFDATRIGNNLLAAYLEAPLAADTLGAAGAFLSAAHRFLRPVSPPVRNRQQA